MIHPIQLLPGRTLKDVAVKDRHDNDNPDDDKENVKAARVPWKFDFRKHVSFSVFRFVA